MHRSDTAVFPRAHNVLVLLPPSLNYLGELLREPLALGIRYALVQVALVLSLILLLVAVRYQVDGVELLLFLSRATLRCVVVYYVLN